MGLAAVERAWQRAVLRELGIDCYRSLIDAPSHRDSVRLPRGGVHFQGREPNRMHAHISGWLLRQGFAESGLSEAALSFGATNEDDVVPLPALPRLRGDARLKRETYLRLRRWLRDERTD